MPKHDAVNHPSHYADGWSNGAEVWDIVEHLNFNRGNVVKYTARAGKKDPKTLLEDLKKAQKYLEREIAKVEYEARVAEAAKAVSPGAYSLSDLTFLRSSMSPYGGYPYYGFGDPYRAYSYAGR